MGLEPPRSFPISWYCKLDTGMHKPNMHPELFMQPKGCNLTCCSDLPIWQALYQPGMVLHPSRPKSEQVHLNSPPQFNLAFKPKNKWPRSWHNTAQRAIPPQFKQCIRCPYRQHLNSLRSQHQKENTNLTFTIWHSE